MSIATGPVTSRLGLTCGRTRPLDAMRIVILAALGLALAGCQGSRDPFCLAHNAADLTPAPGAYAAMKPSERRAAEDRLNATAQRCGWEP